MVVLTPRLCLAISMFGSRPPPGRCRARVRFNSQWGGARELSLYQDTRGTLQRAPTEESNGGISRLFQPGRRRWIPAFAGMTPIYNRHPAQAGASTSILFFAGPLLAGGDVVTNALNVRRGRWTPAGGGWRVDFRVGWDVFGTDFQINAW